MALMYNNLPTGLNGFTITNGVAAFLKDFCSLEDSFSVVKVENAESDLVLLICKNSTSTVVIKAFNNKKAFKIDAQKSLPSNGIAVSKEYFSDVMKRITTTKTETTMSIKIANNTGTCEVVSRAMTQGVPVVVAKGSGDYEFTIKPDMLTSITFNNVSTGGQYLFFYLDKDETGKVTLCVTDEMVVKSDSETHVWHTYTKGLTFTKGDFQWN
jgi:hypothetical protein